MRAFIEKDEGRWIVWRVNNRLRVFDEQVIQFLSKNGFKDWKKQNFKTRNEAVVALDRWKIKQLPVPGERTLNLPPEVFDDFQEPEPPKPKPNQPEYRGHFR